MSRRRLTSSEEIEMTNRMLKIFTVAACAGGALAIARPGRAADVHISVGIPAPPSIVFQTEPEVVVVPQSRVYYVPSASDYDMYRYGGYWYVNRGGYWYRGSNYNGPFRVVEYRRLPHQIVVLPQQYRHHPLHPPHGGGHGHGHHDHDHHDHHGH
jgi:hypothetical protein